MFAFTLPALLPLHLHLVSILHLPLYLPLPLYMKLSFTFLSAPNLVLAATAPVYSQADHGFTNLLCQAVCVDVLQAGHLGQLAELTVVDAGVKLPVQGLEIGEFTVIIRLD